MIEENVALLPYNTFKINANARYFANYSSVAELIEILQNEICQKEKTLQIGGGSNLLFMNDFDGLVLHSNIRFIQRIEDELHSAEEDKNQILIEAGAGVTWDDFVIYCVNNELYGAENLSNIPGQVGASAVQNIGAYGVEAKDIIHEVKCVNINTQATEIFRNSDLQFDYRMSRFKKEWKNKYIITSVVYKLSTKTSYNLNYNNLQEAVERNGEISLQNIRNTILQIRNAKLPDPEIIGNAGSFFMNPIVTNEKFEELLSTYPKVPHYTVSDTEVKIPAAWLIEMAGFKGKKMGNAAVHTTQPLVLINAGGATGREIMALAQKIQTQLLLQFDIILEQEVIVVENTNNH